jgi:hypothetical protein
VRTPPTEQVETDILYASRRRCALCFGLYGDLTPKRGQLAHVERDAARSGFDDLCYLCLPHHDEYDSKNSQSKRFTPSELRRYRSDLYEYVSSGKPLAEVSTAKRSEDKPFFALIGNSSSAGTLDLDLRNEGAPVNCLDFHAVGSAARVRSWYPRSLPNGELLRSKVELSNPNINGQAFVFRMRVRDRSDAERLFQLTLDFRASPPLYDAIEIF